MSITLHLQMPHYSYVTGGVTYVGDTENRDTTMASQQTLLFVSN